MFGIGMLPSTTKPPRPSTANKLKKLLEVKEPVKIKRPQSSRSNNRNIDREDSLINNTSNQCLSNQVSNDSNKNKNINDSDNCITNMIKS